MNDNETIFQKGGLIPLDTPRAIWDIITANTLERAEAGEIEACHKSIATMATMLKIIKDLGSHNEALHAQSPAQGASDTPPEALPPTELRARLTRYLTRLDAELGLVTVANDHDDE